MKKILSVFLTVLMLASMLTGCQEKTKKNKTKTEAIEKIPYTLDEETVKSFDELLQEAEKLGKGDDLEAAESAIELLDDAYMDLIDQSQIAYVHYCTDQSNSEWKEQYLYAEEVVNQAEADYTQMSKRVYLAESPIRDALFADWSQAEIDMMLAYNEEIKELNNRNTELTTQFRELEEDDDWEKNMVKLYNEMVKNNNRIAEIYGYENYYDFAYQMVYKRDYDLNELETMRKLVAQYLPECYDNCMYEFYEVYDAFTNGEKRQLNSLMFDSYDELETDYVSLYLADMPQSAQEGMSDMFGEDRSVFTHNENAYEGAFTTFIGDAPFCFFGPGYDNCETVIHELGHYYGSKYVEAWSQPMDLAETQSQGNEWLYTKFLQNHVPIDLYIGLVEYKMLSAMGNIIGFVMIDEFEQQVYSHENAGDLTLRQYNQIMENVAESYGGMDYITENIMDIQIYWKYVVLESPVYYISYAVSGVAAVNLFAIAEEDETKAREIYCKLLEEPLEDGGFLENISHAGLTGPFTEDVYIALCDRYRK